jgi:hypothetical protein
LYLSQDDFEAIWLPLELKFFTSIFLKISFGLGASELPPEKMSEPLFEENFLS